MKIKKVIVSTKKTSLEHYKECTDFLSNLLPPDELEEKRHEHKNHYASLNLIKEVLTRHGIEFERSYMPYSEFDDFKGKDLIICVGGDGTVLNSSQYTRDKTPVLTVRSDKKSSGALCEIDAKDFEAALERLYKDDFAIEEWTRAKARFEIDAWTHTAHVEDLYALNEFFVGTRHNPAMGAYEITHNGKTEYQRSSGVVISTGTGHSGWHGNIPFTDEDFPRTAKELQFIVRETRKTDNYEIKKGTVRLGEVLYIKSKMDVDGCISIDGDYNKRMFNFPRGNVVEITVADTPLYVTKFKDLCKG